MKTVFIKPGEVAVFRIYAYLFVSVDVLVARLGFNVLGNIADNFAHGFRCLGAS